MNLKFKLRLAGLGLAVGLLGALIVAVTLTSQQQAEESRARLGQVDLESARIADRFKDKLRYANDRMRQYSSGRDRAVWAEFLKASEELKSWIDTQAPNLAPGLEQEVLKDMGAAYAVYMQRARDLHDRMETTGESSASLAEYNGFSSQSRRLNDLGVNLARIHYDSRNEVLTQANRTLAKLSLSVLGLVGLLFVFGLALAALVYRDIIAPLRVKLVESQALAERNEKLASLGLLAAGVAHEIRNPLTAIKAALFIQQKKFRPGSPEQGDIEVVEREILRLERIVNEFLRFARPADPELATVPADQPLEEVQALLTSQLAKDGIRLVREAAPPMRVTVDPGQIKQVLISLVQNAADSMNGGGTITLRTRHDRKRLANGEAEVVILEVADTGKGIPPEVEARLFDPFFTTKDNGTGLGLSIAARIVEKQGGSLQYQTQVNRGTTFGIVLPEATT
ncbi:MAG: two-component system sensor histidine kinase NtrB [Limisphaerales bacterium]